MHKTNRLHLVVCVLLNTQRASEHDKNISHATHLWLVAYFFVHTTYDEAR